VNFCEFAYVEYVCGNGHSDDLSITWVICTQQAAVLSLYLFATYVDNLVHRIRHCPSECYVKMCVWVFSINQSEQIYIAPCVANESEVWDGRD